MTARDDTTALLLKVAAETHVNGYDSGGDQTDDFFIGRKSDGGIYYHPQKWTAIVDGLSL